MLVKTSRPAHLKANDWKVNGAGHKGAAKTWGLGRAGPGAIRAEPVGDLPEPVWGNMDFSQKKKTQTTIIVCHKNEECELSSLSRVPTVT